MLSGAWNPHIFTLVSLLGAQTPCIFTLVSLSGLQNAYIFLVVSMSSPHLFVGLAVWGAECLHVHFFKRIRHKFSPSKGGTSPSSASRIALSVWVEASALPYLGSNDCMKLVRFHCRCACSQDPLHDPLLDERLKVASVVFTYDF